MEKLAKENVKADAFNFDINFEMQDMVLLTTKKQSDWLEEDSEVINNQQTRIREIIENHLNSYPVAIKQERIKLNENDSTIVVKENFNLLDFENGNDMKNGMDVYINKNLNVLTAYIYGSQIKNATNLDVTKYEFYCVADRNEDMLFDLTEAIEEFEQKTYQRISRIKVQYEVNRIEENVRREYDLDSDWYGDCYGSLVESETGLDLMLKMEFAKTQKEYDQALEEIKENFDVVGKTYNEQQQTM